jgi:hypothetical protein
MKVAQNLGLIRVTVRRCTWKKVAKQKIRPRRSLSFRTDNLSLAGKALKGKAISHGAA